MINEVIETLKAYTDGKGNAGKVEISVMQLNRIIKALEQQPTDAVDRVTIKEYMDSFGTAYELGKEKGLDIALDILGKYTEEGNEKIIRDLPSETPQPKMGSSSENPNKCGKWRHYEGMLYCSRCGAEFYDEIMEYTGDEVPKYCPQCGQPKRQEVEE